jgi:diguanylate cyclase (GGDEF)-like protein
MGGDEFAVVMPGIAGPDAAVQVANELVAGLAEPFILPDQSAQLSGSIGIALYPQHADSVEGLTQCADMAMYAAKHAGKNQVQIWKG